MVDLKPPVLRHFCTLEVAIATPMSVGSGRAGQRRIIPITGGRVTGPGLSGRVVGVGADWQTVRPDGVAELSAQYAFETDDGALIEILNTGYRHAPDEVNQRIAAGEAMPPESYYMRTTARLETGHPGYAWVNRTMFVGTGAKTATGVQIDLYAVD